MQRSRSFLFVRGVVAAVLAGALIGFFALFWGQGRAPRYVFVDCGAHEGETVLGFEKSTLFKKHPWSMVSFEPNPTLFPRLPKRPFLSTMERAVWTKDEELVFNFSEQNTLGGSLVPTVIRAPEMQAVKVKAIDFARWLQHNYTKSDVVYVKFDIEGAEYPVLEKMLKDGTMTLVDRLYIEFHGAQQLQAANAPGSQVAAAERKDRELVEAISGVGTAVSVHLADEPQGAYFGFDPEKYGQSW
jgi:FkbM family methyltransferase